MKTNYYTSRLTNQLGSNWIQIGIYKGVHGLWQSSLRGGQTGNNYTVDNNSFWCSPPHPSTINLPGKYCKLPLRMTFPPKWNITYYDSETEWSTEELC